MSRTPLDPRVEAAHTLELDDLADKLERFGDDPRLRYFVAQLARREGRQGEAEEMLFPPERRRRGRGRDQTVDGLALMTGALAVSETLQLDAFALSDEQLAQTPAAQAELPVDDLTGPTVRSHPFEEMEQRRADVPALFRLCPRDQWAVSLPAGAGEAGGKRAWSALEQELSAQTGMALRRDDLAWLLGQWGLGDDDDTAALMAALDGVPVAATGSDLAFALGVDVTLLIDIRAHPEREERLQQHVERVGDRPDVKLKLGRREGFDVLALLSADHSVKLFSARPDDHTFAVSNSPRALDRVLRVARGDAPALADADEVAVMRHLLPATANERAFAYLSDAFIRRLLGPAARVASLRRAKCRQLRAMLGYASELFALEHDRAPNDVAELYAAGCAPGLFGSGWLACPEHGTLALDERGRPRCGVHGRLRGAHGLAELEPLVERITPEEKAQYEVFVREYSQRWRQYFDPIGVRLETEGGRAHIETVVLPLIDNSIYEGLRASVGALAPRTFSKLGRPASTVFAFEALVSGEPLAVLGLQGLGRTGGDERALEELVEQGRGTFTSEVGVHFLDHDPLFELDLRTLLGLAQGAIGSVRDIRGWMWWVLGVLGSLHSPLRFAVGVEDEARARRFVELLLEQLALTAQRLASAGPMETSLDVCELGDDDGQTWCVTLGALALRIRLFIRVTADAVLISNTNEAVRLAAEPITAGSAAHARLAIRPLRQHRGVARALFARRERERHACFEALGRAAVPGADRRDFSCPSGGTLLVDSEDDVACSAHGHPARPRNAADDDAHASAHDVEARLSFEEGGLRARIEVTGV
jgi:hypothetical protein